MLMVQFSIFCGVLHVQPSIYNEYSIYRLLFYDYGYHGCPVCNHNLMLQMKPPHTLPSFCCLSVFYIFVYGLNFIDRMILQKLKSKFRLKILLCFKNFKQLQLSMMSKSLYQIMSIFIRGNILEFGSINYLFIFYATLFTLYSFSDL